MAVTGEPVPVTVNGPAVPVRLKPLAVRVAVTGPSANWESAVIVRVPVSSSPSRRLVAARVGCPVMSFRTGVPADAVCPS